MKKLFSGLKTKRSHEAKEIAKLHRAACEGDMSKLKEFAKRIDVNEVDKHNRTALHLACANGMVEEVKFLVENRANLNLVDKLNRSPLIKAVEGRHENIVELLLENNANPNLMDVNGNTALHLASSIPNISIVLMLVKHNADINAQNQEGLSPLMMAAMEGHINVADFLLRKGADVNILDDKKRSPLMVAARRGHSDMVRLLLQFQEVTTLKDKKDQSPEYDDRCVLLARHDTQRNQLGSTLRQRTSKSGTEKSKMVAGAATNTGDAGSLETYVYTTAGPEPGCILPSDVAQPSVAESAWFLTQQGPAEAIVQDLAAQQVAGRSRMAGVFEASPAGSKFMGIVGM
uniref:ankyrin repeat domain-containing protein 7-like n=1 Tax=Doryrhamphus excisus TaxID=161450 RepID=UPI0025ADB7BA|nr:ankyrin repeat domain-containing protein 7-like [Doryrhamphus excisus]